MEVDGNGDMVWTRTDSYVFPEDDGEVAETAAEHVIITPDGRIGLVMDQDFGIGLLVLE